MHPAGAHCLDVAAVACLLPRPTRTVLPRQLLGFLVALHDVGKFSRPFQSKVPEHWPNDTLGPAPAGSLPGLRHDALGYHLLEDALVGSLDTALPPRQPNTRGWSGSDLGHVLQAIAGHHGRPVTPDSAPQGLLSDAATQAAQDFAAAMLAVFHPPPLAPPPSRFEAAQLGWDLAGVVTLADWIGSRTEWFPYVPVAALADPSAYFWEHAIPRAVAALSAAGLSSQPAATFTGTRGLFPGVTQPSPVQVWAERVPLPPGPILAVIEDVTGSGKTEAAVTLAHRLLASGQAYGVFLALPTMATANAMFGRMADAYRGLFAVDARPSLVLAHGRAALHPGFAGLMDGGPARGREAADPADTPSEAHCAAWLAEDRRRALIAQFGVGTIDQAILAVLPVRHAALRLQGLKGKVLVVDEAHAFDPYMQRELVELLRFHAALGGSAILLSATLTKALRQRLVDAFRAGLSAPAAELVETAYPLATLASADAVSERPCAIRDGLARQVTVTRLPTVAAALARIVAAERTGAAVAWVRNTVDDAMEAAQALREQGVEPLLFHARFAMADRLIVEQEVLRRFGRASAGKARQAVLIATQVIEQSLDLDFDILCTDLAPADLLIQRAGRLWRHERGARPVAKPELLVLSPEPVADPTADWVRTLLPGTAAVYRDPALLWRGARAVFAASTLTTPDDMRPLVEQAADEGTIPPGLAAQVVKAKGEALAAGELGRQNVLAFEKGYTRQNGAWEPDTRTPTRLEARPQVMLRLALVQDGVVVPYAEADTPARAWSLSEVSVAAYHVSACPVPTGLEAAAELARQQWGRWEQDDPRMLLAVLTKATGNFTLATLNETGDHRKGYYDPHSGLSLSS